MMMRSFLSLWLMKGQNKVLFIPMNAKEIEERALIIYKKSGLEVLVFAKTNEGEKVQHLHLTSAMPNSH